jgi:regulator of sigma E protease
MFVLLTIFIFLIILTILVVIHEAGHYFTAKFFGIKVEEFGFGFPPKALSIKKGETVYSINWLPIGGFVKLYGEDEAGGGSVKLKPSEKVADEKRAFYAQNVWKRALVVVAGVVMNTVLAMVIFYIFFVFSNFQTILPKIGDYKFFGANQRIIEQGVVVENVAKNSPAAAIGIKPKSKILSVAGKKVTSQQGMLSVVAENKGKQIPISWQELTTKKIHTKKITPRVNPPKNQGSLGIQFEFSPVALMVISYDTPTQKLFSGITQTLNIMPWQLDAIGSLITKSMKENNAKPVSEAVSGPVGIGFAVGSILQIPNIKVAVLQLLNLAAIMSAALAFFNVLPIPALDGGRLFFILIEGITGRKVNQKVEGMIHTAGFVVLLGLILLITFQDLNRFVVPLFFK